MMIDALPDLRRAIYLMPALALALASCSPTAPSQEQEDSESEPEERTATRTWVDYTSAHRISTRMASENGNYLQARDTRSDPITEPEKDWETNLDLLVDARILQESEEGYSPGTEQGIAGAADNIQVDRTIIADAVDELLRDNEVDWCSTNESGGEFRRGYLDIFLPREGTFYETQEEHLESIEDYVDCGDGHI